MTIKTNGQINKSLSVQRKQFKSLHIGFDLKLYPRQISQFRGAIAEAAGLDKDWFHNHNNGELKGGEQLSSKQYHYRYPLIQYRSRKGKGEIWAINQGAEVLRDWVLQSGGKLKMGGKEIPLRINYLKETEHEISMLERMRCYRLMDYLALNQENHQKWLDAKDFFERGEILQNTLTGHLLCFAKGINWQLPERLEVQLYDVRSRRPVEIHGTQKIAFNLLFKTNIDLPKGIALGRAVSFGFGQVQPTKNDQL